MYASASGARWPLLVDLQPLEVEVCVIERGRVVVHKVFGHPVISTRFDAEATGAAAVGWTAVWSIRSNAGILIDERRTEEC